MGRRLGRPTPPQRAPVGPQNGVGVPSVVSCDNVGTVPKDRLGEQIGFLLDTQEQALSDAIRASFDLD